MTSDWMRLLEGLKLEKLTAEQAIREIQRIADGTMKDMSAGYYVARMGAIGELATVAAARLDKPATGR